MAGRLDDLNVENRSRNSTKLRCTCELSGPSSGFFLSVRSPGVSAIFVHAPLKQDHRRQLQREVSVLLEQMGWSHTFEHVTREGFSLDLAQPDSKRAIEVDGPSHFLKDATSGGYIFNGATQFKSRLLRSYGWQVAHVAFFEFERKSEVERRDLLLGKVVETGVIHETITSA